MGVYFEQEPGGDLIVFTDRDDAGNHRYRTVITPPDCDEGIDIYIIDENGYTWGEVTAQYNYGIDYTTERDDRWRSWDFWLSVNGIVVNTGRRSLYIGDSDDRLGFRVR